MRLKSTLLQSVFRHLLCVSGILLGGCPVGPDFESPTPPQTKSYLEGESPKQTATADVKGGQAQIFYYGRDVPAQWWHLFHSKALNELIERALKNNPTFAAAQATWRQAEESVRVATASLFPFVTVQPQYQRIGQNYAPLGFSGIPTQTFNLYNASTNVTYVLDVWGAVRRHMETNTAHMDRTEFLVEATYLTLIANIVTTAITEASLRAQLVVIEKLIKLLEQFVDYTEKKQKLGAISILDVFAEKERLYNIQASIYPIRLALAQTRHALAALVGETPHEANLPVFNLEDFTLPTDIPVTLPSHLVRQRPDIRGAEETLHATCAQIGVATANLLPQVNISGNYGWSAKTLNDYFVPSNALWNITAGLLQPVFEGGALLAKRREAIAAFDAAYGDYKATVLHAFQNVADTLRALEIDAQALAIHRKAEETAKETLKVTESQLKIGAVTYLNVLEAEQSWLQASLARIRSQASRLADTTALFQALGGGWWNRKCSLVGNEKKSLEK